MQRRIFVGAAACAGVAASLARAQTRVQISELKQQWNAGLIDIKTDGQEFAVYNFDHAHGGLYRPFFHPIFGPNGGPITQNGEFPGTLRGHYWHRGLFVAHQRVNALSFWEERTADCGKMVHLGFDEVSNKRFVERIAWQDLAGQDVLREVRTVSVPPPSAQGRMLDITIRLTAVAPEVVFGATPYNLLACRVINSIAPTALKDRYSKRYGRLVDSLSPAGEGGLVTNSDGKADDACRGARARWCDISGPLGDGNWGGVAIMDHPANPRHPTPFHNWSNLTIMASLTYHEPLTLKRGERVAVAYRVLVHARDAKKADLQEAWTAFSRTDPDGLEES